MDYPFQPLAPDGAKVSYLHGPDSSPRPGVPVGEIHAFDWSASRIFPDTTRRVWVHVPAGIDPTVPSQVAVFQDGWWYLDPGDQIRAGVVLDNLVAREAIAPTIGVFVDPGTRTDAGSAAGPRQRNVEYDAADDTYARFITEEILPFVAVEWRISTDPEATLICGGSSGGNAAFTAAWHRPERFGHVISFLASFAQMPGGNPYPEVIAAEASPRPLKVFLQAAHRDIGWDQPERNWLAENLTTAAALARAGYDFRLVVGDGGHSPNHAGALLPEALLWHWGRDRDGCAAEA